MTREQILLETLSLIRRRDELEAERDKLIDAVPSLEVSIKLGKINDEMLLMIERLKILLSETKRLRAEEVRSVISDNNHGDYLINPD